MNDHRPNWPAVAIAVSLLYIPANAVLADSHEKTVGESIGETSRDVSDATKEGYETSKEWVQDTSGDVADATKEGYESSKEWVSETSSDAAEATKEGYEDAKEATGQFADDVQKGYEKKDD